MKETLAYDVLTVMQEKKGERHTASAWKGWFSVLYYRYEGVHKRVCDLVANGCAMRAGATDDGLLLYKVSDKGLLINSFEDYKKATYKPRTPKPKKTREESNCKKESRDWREGNKEVLTNMEGVSAFINDNGSVGFGPSLVKKECKMIGEGAGKATEPHCNRIPVSGPSEEEMREIFTSLCNKYENDGVSKEDIAIRFGVPLSYNGTISPCIKEMIDKDTPIGGDKHSPRSPPVGYTAWTQITTTHRNEQGDIVIGYKVNTQVTEEEHKAKEIREKEERDKLYKDTYGTMHFSTREEMEEERRNPTILLGPNAGKYMPKQPRYKRLRLAFTGK